MNRFIRVTLILFSLFFTSGCATGYYYSNEQQLQMASAFRFPDLPIPEGFKFIPANSFIYESSEIRVGTMRYYGKAWPGSIVRFYKRYMARSGWQILNIIEGKETLLSFSNNQEICIVKFECSYGKGSLVITVSPMFREEPGYSGFTYNTKNSNTIRKN